MTARLTTATGVEVTGSTSWMASALCGGDPYFDSMPTGLQLATCRRCPVRAQCLAYAEDLERNLQRSFIYDLPIYGGRTGADRARARRRAEDRARAEWVAS